MLEPIVNFESLPIWRGCVSEPGNYVSLDFSIVADDSGLMYQPFRKQLEDSIISKYSGDDYGFITKPPGHSEWANYLGDQLFDFSASIIGDRRGLRILEIGGGATYVAKKICDRFFVDEYLLVDPALDSDDEGHEKISLIPEYYSGQDFGCFDVVLMFNCLEHIPNPMGILDGISKIKNKNESYPEVGLVFPNVQDQILRYDFNVFLHEHINYFTPKSVQNLISNAGLQILDYKSDGDEFKLILRASDRLVHNTRLVHDSREDIITIASVFHEKIECTLRNMSSYLNSTDNIGVHGANNGLNNLLHIAPWISNNSRITVYDGDRTKKNMWLPAMSRHPITIANDRLERKPEIMIVSAMTYYNQIVDFWKNTHGFSDLQIQPLFRA